MGCHPVAACSFMIMEFSSVRDTYIMRDESVLSIGGNAGPGGGELGGLGGLGGRDGGGRRGG